jgi:hypothetical protein
MKKIFYVFFILLILSNKETIAQNKKNNSSNSSSSGLGCFNETSKIINLGIGFGGSSYYSYNKGIGYSYHSSPAFSLSYEQALSKKLGPGYLGVGGYLGYQSAYLQYDNYYYNNTQYYYRHNWKYMLISARAAYHLDFFNKEKAELYFGAVAGFRYQSYSYETNSTDPNRYDNQLTNSSLNPSFSLFVGGRWYFAKQIALFGEAGFGISYLTLGLSFKF